MVWYGVVYSSSLSQCSANLHLLSLMPLEVEDMDVSRSLSVEIKEHLHTLLPNVLQVWCRVLNQSVLRIRASFVHILFGLTLV